jgi:hypothetical protein
VSKSTDGGVRTPRTHVVGEEGMVPHQSLDVRVWRNSG